MFLWLHQNSSYEGYLYFANVLIQSEGVLSIRINDCAVVIRTVFNKKLSSCLYQNLLKCLIYVASICNNQTIRKVFAVDVVSFRGNIFGYFNIDKALLTKRLCNMELETWSYIWTIKSVSAFSITGKVICTWITQIQFSAVDKNNVLKLLKRK